ncbi:hypothetical protein D046_2500B, partial [Vibrio parahaemolyticus V-223/04]
ELSGFRQGDFSRRAMQQFHRKSFFKCRYPTTDLCHRCFQLSCCSGKTVGFRHSNKFADPFPIRHAVFLSTSFRQIVMKMFSSRYALKTSEFYASGNGRSSPYCASSSMPKYSFNASR